MPTAPAADELDNWAQENYSLSASAAASLRRSWMTAHS
jgi:hypothetical protein